MTVVKLIILYFFFYTFSSKPAARRWIAELRTRMNDWTYIMTKRHGPYPLRVPEVLENTYRNAAHKQSTPLYFIACIRECIQSLRQTKLIREWFTKPFRCMVKFSRFRHTRLSSTLFFSDLRYAVQHSDCRKSGAKVIKNCKSPTKYIRNLIISSNIFEIYQFLY